MVIPILWVTKDLYLYYPGPIVSKILEKMVAIQLSNYLENNNRLTNSQHGFRPKLSRETALTTITDEIYENSWPIVI